MKKKIMILVLIFCTVGLFVHQPLITSNIITSGKLFFYHVFPSLFPMMILSSLFLYFDLEELLWSTCQPLIQKCFHLSQCGFCALFVSFFSGTPTNVYFIKNLRTENKISIMEGNLLLQYAFFNNPFFIYHMLSLIFSDLKTVWLLMLTPYLVNSLLLILHKKENKTSNSLSQNKENFGSYLAQTIRDSMNTLLFIFGTITLFFILNVLINPHQIPIISGFLEISQGLSKMILTNYPTKVKEIFTMSIMSFGGLSIHLQVKGIIDHTALSYKNFLKGRIIQLLLSNLFVFFLG